MDSLDRVVKEPVFPVARDDGQFDILLQRTDGNSEKFTRALSSLSVGDELAYKAGRRRLNYIGQDAEIRGITILASSIGIAPALQILRGILPDQDRCVFSHNYDECFIVLFSF